MSKTHDTVAELISKLKECRERKDLKGGKLVHHLAIKEHCHRNRYIATALITMYSICGAMSDALDVFNSMRSKDVVSWTSLILGYTENGNNKEALEAFDGMDCAPDSVTFVVALKACSNLASEKTTENETCLANGMEIHHRAIKFGFEKDQTISNSLIHMYGNCRCMVYARDVFDNLHKRSVVSWTSLILGYVNSGEYSEALNVFSMMDCPPDSVAFVAAFKACTGLAGENLLSKEKLLETIESIHKHVKLCGCERDLAVKNSLLNLYCKSGCIEQARDMFEIMHVKDVVSWSTLVLGYVENGQSLEALEIFSRMTCVPDRVVFLAVAKACAKVASEDKNKTFCIEKVTELQTQTKKYGFDKDPSFGSTLVGVYSHCNDMVTAQKHFDEMASRDTVAWNALLLGYVENGKSFRALELFNGMDCEPDRLTFIATLKACSSLGYLTTGKKLHCYICRLGYEQNVEIGSSLIDLYGSCGNIPAAELVFDQMHTHDEFSWSSLIRGYCILGRSFQVFQLVHSMQYENPEMQMDHVLLQLVLSACSRSGHLDDGKRWLERSGIDPDFENYASMVEMLGRTNTQEALSVVKGLPFKAKRVLWLTLLAACGKWNDVQTGKVAFDALVTEKGQEC